MHFFKTLKFIIHTIQSSMSKYSPKPYHETLSQSYKFHIISLKSIFLDVTVHFHCIFKISHRIILHEFNDSVSKHCLM